MQAAPTAVGGPLVHRGNTDGGAILHDDRGQKYLSLQTLDTGCGAQGPLDEDDDGDDSNDEPVELERTRRVINEPAGYAFESQVADGDALARGSNNGPEGGYQIKNTFIHIDCSDDETLARAESNDPLGRTESDPTGQKYPLPRRPKKQSPTCHTVIEDPAILHGGAHPAPEAIGEEDEGEGDSSEEEGQREEEDEADGGGDQPLERTAVYVPPAMQPRPAAATASQTPAASLRAYPPGYDAQQWHHPGFQMPPYGMYPGMYAAGWMHPQGKDDWCEQAPVYPLGEGPPMGTLHSFHRESNGFGILSPDLRQFTKGQDYEGRLSVVSESEVHKDGLQRYLLQFSTGELSKADGIGFVFAARLPCAKNIQKIVSVFVNQRGQICMRVFGNVIKASNHTRPIKVGDWVEMAVDLERCVATFNIWPGGPMGWVLGQPDSTAEFHYGKRLAKASQTSPKPIKLNVGHFACVIQNVGVTVTLGS